MAAASLLAHLLAMCFALAGASPATCGEVARDNVLIQMKQSVSSSSSCCSACAGHAYCSPKSGNCYDIKKQHYYKTCDSGSGGLAPSPAHGGNGNCCSKCGGSYCSPVSGNCYTNRKREYYLSCTGEDDAKYEALIWSDEFDDINGDGSVDNSKWQYLNGDNPNNQELQYYTHRAENSRIEDGVLKIIAKCEEHEGFHYTSARLVTRNMGDWGPGHRVEVRAKVPNNKGTWPAIWMLPTENAYGHWPDSGEIDIMESVGCTPGSVYGTVHTGAYNHMKNTQKGQKYYTDETQWHNYTIDWEDSYIHFYVDGNHYNTFAPDIGSSDKWPFDKRFYLILNVAVGGSWGGFCLKEPPSCDAHGFGTPQVMEVDYVRIYSRGETSVVNEVAQ